MLVLSRRADESIVLGDQITVTVVEVRGNRVRLAIDAPEEVRVLRKELVDAAQHSLGATEAKLVAACSV